MRTCSIDGCNNKHSAKGYCKKHYRRFVTHGDPLHTERERHGMKNTSEYNTWANMKGRCYNKRNQDYKYYGAKGITVYDRWRYSFKAFFADMGVKPFPKAQIDRIDSKLNYTKNNCHWATATENSRNRSCVKLTLQKAKEIRKMYKNGGITLEKLGFIYGVHLSLISLIITNKNWIETA